MTVLEFSAPSRFIGRVRPRDRKIADPPCLCSYTERHRFGPRERSAGRRDVRATAVVVHDVAACVLAPKRICDICSDLTKAGH